MPTLADVTPAPTTGDASPLIPRASRLAPWFAALWLFFLLNPLLAAWARRDEPRGIAALLVTVAFGAAYLVLWIRARTDRQRLIENPPRRLALAYVGTLLGLAAAMIGLLGEDGVASVVYLAVACVMVFPLRLAGPVVLALAAAVVALGGLEHWGSQVSTGFSVLAASVAIYGLRAVMSRNIALLRAQRENAELAVENERTRFARDLHDILGHSLTVITVKAELAQRLIDVDPERTRTELADLERLSRDALADVRRAVSGYRELTLPGELTRARMALAGADIEAVLPGSTEDVPGELRELFAWTVREGVTNVLRHSGATRCEVRLTARSAEVRDDGTAGASARLAGEPASPGSGLAGLRERAAAVGADVVVRRLDPGFCLEVRR